MIRARVIMGLAVTLAATACFADNWTLPRANTQLTNSTSEPLTAPLSLAWEYQTNANIGNTSQPVVVGNSVFFSSGDRVFCLDTSSGAVKWYYPTDQPLGSQIKTSLAYDSERIFFGANDGSLYCLSATNGSQLWSYATGFPIRSSPMIYDNRVYFGSDDKSLHCVDVRSGEPLWLGGFHTGDDVVSTPALDSGMIFFLSRDTFFYAANLDGKLRWRYRLAVPSVNVSPVIGPEAIYIGASNLLSAMNIRSGGMKWSIPLPSEAAAPPAYADKALYIALRNKRMYAVTSQGRAKWATGFVNTVNPARCSPLVAGNTVLLAADKGIISAWDTETAELKWRYLLAPALGTAEKLQVNNVSSPPVWANGTLFILADDGALRAFRSDVPDTMPPDVYNLTPLPGSAVSGSPPLKLSATIVDQGSGIDESSVTMSLDDVAVTYEYDAATGSLTYTTPYTETQQPLSDGQHEITISVKDWKGNLAKVNWSFLADSKLPKPHVRIFKKPSRGKDGSSVGTGDTSGSPSGSDTGPMPPPPPPPSSGGDGPSF